MADQRVYGFDEQGFRRVQEATRVTLGTARAGTHRRRQTPVTGQRNTIRTDPPSFTICSYDAGSGEQLALLDRGRPRSGSVIADVDILYSSDGYLYAAGIGFINEHTGMLKKYDPDKDYELLWTSAQGSFHYIGTFAPATNTGKQSRSLVEASDGYIWIITAPDTSGKYYALRHDPDDGTVTHESQFNTSVHAQLVKGDNGSVIVVYSSKSSGTKWLRRLDATATETHSYATKTVVVEELNGKLYCITDSTGTSNSLTGDGLVILNASDLSVVTSRAVPAGEQYISLCTDGTTVWTIAGTAASSNNKYRAYNASNLATENWNGTRSTSANPVLKMAHDSTYFYEFGAAIKKLNDNNGSTVWTAASDGHSGDTGIPSTAPVGGLRIGVGLGSDFIVVTNNGNFTNAANTWCIEKSTGLGRWYDQFLSATGLLGGRAVAISPDDDVFICGYRTPA